MASGVVRASVQLVRLSAAIYVLLHTALAIRWLAMTRQELYWNRTADCVKARRSKDGGFSKHEASFCRANLELMPTVAQAARDTVFVCHELFIDRRWNCSSIRLAPRFLPDLNKGTREQSFVYSLTAAALTQAVARACSLGVSTRCGCGRLPNEPPGEDFRWGGCGDDVSFGTVFSRNFLTNQANKKSSRQSLLKQHNYEVGRKVAVGSLRTDCKCHGVSGSCSLRTCWKALADVMTVGAELQQRYDNQAVQVVVRRAANISVLVPVGPRQMVTYDDFVYDTLSPDYCWPDKASGSYGTQHRECDKNSESGSSSCNVMCCGRGHHTEIVEIQYRCECKYYWCCYVKCKTCTKTVEITRCK